ncbi:MAG: hypothetical protein U5Q44_07050 [Dehalococcoidia bacterium]|nr:hypothetical protein [Dehalococcoidia bacterium]
MVLGSVAGGLLVDATGIDAAFYLGGAVMLAGIPVFLAMTKGVAVTETEIDEVLGEPGASPGVAGQPGGGGH